MIKKGKIIGFCICLAYISALLCGEFIARKYGPLYYLPERIFWKLERFTNLGGQFDGKEKFVLWHTGVPFNENVIVKKPAGVKRVVILGTSSAEGYRVSRSDNFSSQLQRLLDRHYGSGKVEVINAAVGGYTSFQLLVYFQEVLLKLSPDIVILYLAHNDSIYKGPFTARDYYEKVRIAFLGLGNDPGKKKRLLKYGLNGLSPLYSFFAESRLFGYFFINASEKLVKSKQLVPPSDQEYVLRQFISLSKQYDFKLIFAAEAVRRWGEKPLLFYYALMRDVAEKERILFINMMSLLREYLDDTVFLGGNDVVHLNPFGHQLVGEKLFEQVKEMDK